MARFPDRGRRLRLARPVKDNVLLTGAIAGPDPLDPSKADLSVPDDQTLLKGDISKLQVGGAGQFLL